MHREKLIDLINWLEDNTLITQWVVNGVKIWPLIRIKMYFECMSKKDIVINQEAISKNILKYRISRSLKKNIDSLENKVFDYVFLTDSVCNKKIISNYVNIYVDPIIESYNINNKEHLILEYYDEHKFTPMPSGPRFYINQEIKEHIEFSKLKINYKYEDFDKIILILIKMKFNNTVSFLMNESNILKFLIERDFYIKLISSIQPNNVFTTCYYGRKMAFISAAKSLNVKTIDIQHGVQGELHAAYGRWNNVPKSGYCMLPDAFWVWSKNDEQAISAWSSSLTQNMPDVVVTGNPWLIKWKQNNFMTNYYDKLFQYNFIDNKQKKLLFTHQDSSLWPEWFIPVLSEISSKFQIFFRLHPSVKDCVDKWKIFFKRNGVNNIVLKRATDWPVLALMRNMDVHVTCHSTCTLEAAELNVFSIVITDDGESYFQNLIQSKKCEPATTKKQFIKILNDKYDTVF